MKILDYEIYNRIYQSNNSIIYRALNKSEAKAVIIKKLNREYPTPIELSRFKREFNIAKSINSKGVIDVYQLKRYQNTLIIIMEDIGGESLFRIQKKIDLSLKQKLSLAINITKYIGRIHQNNIIHMDINPTNIIWNPKSDQFRIIDFGISSELLKENPVIYNHDYLEGTIAYISPEQTGRINRSIDYRTDIYSIGVTLYEMMTGVLPYQTDDELEMIHSHIAKPPDKPHLINPQIPKTLSNIILKLMSKKVDDRYQSTVGIQYDLEKCFEQVNLSGKIKPFEIGTNDFSTRFQISQILYGRQKEISILLAALNRVCLGKMEIMFICGTAGIGKSVLVREICKSIFEKKGYFISGKFNQFKQNIPYIAMIQAIKELIKQLIMESENNLDRWKKKLLKVLGSNGQVIIDVIPEVEMVIGKQRPVPNLPPKESDNRFNLVFTNFVHSIATKEHPIVLFLDDLQWADKSTVNLIDNLLMTSGQYFMIIGAYRDNEVNDTHPLKIAINRLKADEQLNINTITLKSLDIKHINQLLSDTLECDTEITFSLAKICKNKTLGNPFFLHQFLLLLNDKNLFNCDISKKNGNMISKVLKK